ncbi:MAG: heterodisulfide reductase-related iron-sulfur binding cluster, partial [Chloroflexota bacterium]
GKLDFTPRLLDVIYKCTMGGACDTMCKRNIDLEVIDTLAELRAECYRRGKTLPRHDELVASTREKDNPWGVPRESKFSWREGVKIKDITREKAEVLFFASCSPQDERVRAVPRAAVALLQRGGVDVGILGRQERCCGFLAHQVGERQVAVDLIKENIATFNKLGIRTLVTACAACFGAFRAVYPAYGRLNFEVKHISQVLDELLQAGSLSFRRPLDMKVTYHDPCHLGRMSEPYVAWEGTRGDYGRQSPPKELRRGTHGIYQPPRSVLQSIPGLELAEMERVRENAWCCGSGGGVKTACPDFARWTAGERLEEAGTTGAAALVTACPHCEINFKDTIEENNNPIRVYDLVELALEAAGEKEPD